MEPEDAQETAQRDQLWASLRGLRPAIEKLAIGTLKAGERHDQLAQVLARVVIAELDFRERKFTPDQQAD
ncbi:MAG: hypothetical protein ACJ8C4_14260 [Gemmataceae bacterium]